MNNATLRLSELIVKTSFEDIPPGAIKEAKRRIADIIGIGLSGSTTEVGKKIIRFSVAKGGAGKATIWGSGNHINPAYAALANGTMTFHLELDDVHRTSHSHPGVSVIPTAIALCEEYGLSGKELLLAIVLGYDVLIRVGKAVSPSIYVDRVFMAPGTLAIIGATTAATKLHKFNIQTTAQVLGTASFLGPLAPFEAYVRGTGVKETIMGWANFVAINSVELAVYGFNGPVTAIEGDFGYCKAIAERCNLDRIFNGIGKIFEIVNTGIKPYACCRQHHTAVDIILELKKKYNLAAEDVEIIIDRTFLVASRGKEKNPTTIAGAKYSAPYIIAVALTFGKVWREQFTTHLINNSNIQSLASKVQVKADKELDALYDEKWPSIIEITTKKGQILSARRDLPKGEPEYPISDSELKDKFLSLAIDAVTRDRANKIWEAIFELENINNINDLTSLLKINR